MLWLVRGLEGSWPRKQLLLISALPDNSRPPPTSVPGLPPTTDNCLTSNETGCQLVTEVRRESFGLVTERRHILLLCAVTHIFCLLDVPGLCHARHIFHRRVWHRALSLRSLWVYSTFGHHPHPPSYTCGKFGFCRALHCWASPWRKVAYSITHPAYLMCREPKQGRRHGFESGGGQVLRAKRAENFFDPHFLASGDTIRRWH